MCRTTELDHARRTVVERLAEVKMSNGESSSERLSKVCSAICEPTMGWTSGACESLRSKLMWLLDDGEPLEVSVLSPITKELRESCRLSKHAPGNEEIAFSPGEFNDLCDVIDCVHAHLEAENATLRAMLEAPVEPEPDDDVVNHPSHYTQGSVEVIDIIEEMLGPDGFRAYCLGNVTKYVLRHEHKGGDTDLKKAVWYLNRVLGDA